MNDQKQHWNELHTKGKLKDYAKKQTTFADEVIAHFPTDAKVLELGCGLGNDSFFFATQGHTVIATDFSETAIEENKIHYQSQQNLSFQVVDISKPLPFEDNEFDVVYARLSLHYFTDAVTKQVFNELNRILQPKGLLCFLCKSTDDSLYGQGKQIERDMFEYKGHVRHFFSMDYAKQCLSNKYEIKLSEDGKEEFYDRQSAFIKIIAEKM